MSKLFTDRFEIEVRGKMFEILKNSQAAVDMSNFGLPKELQKDLYFYNEHLLHEVTEQIYLLMVSKIKDDRTCEQN